MNAIRNDHERGVLFFRDLPRPFSRHSLSRVVLAVLLATAARAADQPAGPPPQPVLHLTSGEQSSGEIRASTQPGILRWQAATANAPRDFAWKDVRAIQWPPPAAQPQPAGDFCFELAAGDLLFGSLLALGDDQAELDIPRLGRIRVERSRLHRFYRWRADADLIYLGPIGLAGWKEPPGQTNWRDDSGRPATNRQDASMRGDFGLPDRARIEFELSWRSKPDFVFALGVDNTMITLKHALTFEAWGSDLIVQRELERDADLRMVLELEQHGPGRIHLQAYLDQAKGRILVFSPDGKKLADLTVADTTIAALPCLYLTNKRGDLCLQRLRIDRWSGEIPRELRARETRIDRAGGSIIYGQLTGFDAGSKEFRLKTEKDESRIPENQVSSVFISVAPDQAPRMIRAIYQDRSRVSGDLVKVEERVITLAVPGIQEPLQLPTAGLRSLEVTRHETQGGTGL